MGDEGDEDEDTPTSYTFSAESKLDEDHLFYLQFTNNFISNVSRPRDFDHCTRWLEKLAGEPMYGVEAKRNRNMYLAMLLIAMQDNKVKGPFATFPPNGPLPHAGDAFGLTPEEERAGQINLAFDIQDRELIMSEYKYQSADGRTFVATCALPEGLGCMAYVGISYGGGEGLWLNQEGCQVGLTEVLDKDVIPVINPQTPVTKHIEMVETYDWTKPIILPEDAVPFAYLHKVPQVRSNSNLVQIQGAHRLTPFGRVLLLNKYPEELVDFLAKLIEKSKCEIDTLLRERHDKVIAQIYEEYQFEVERWLNEYKLARQEWQQVMNVIREIQEAEVEARKYSIEITEAAGDSMRVLSDALNDARKRKRIGIRDVMRLDNLKTDIHRDIHSRLLLHKRDLAATEARVNEIEGEIKRLRNESRHKRQIVEGLVSELSPDT